jgi:hypothetical protein
MLCLYWSEAEAEHPYLVLLDGEGTPMLTAESLLVGIRTKFYWSGTPMLGLFWSESEAEYLVLLVGDSNAGFLLVGIKGVVLSFIGRGLLCCGLYWSGIKGSVPVLFWSGTPMLGLYWSGIKGSVLSFIGRGLLGCGLHWSESELVLLVGDSNAESLLAGIKG